MEVLVLDMGIDMETQIDMEVPFPLIGIDMEVRQGKDIETEIGINTITSIFFFWGKTTLSRLYWTVTIDGERCLHSCLRMDHGALL